MNRTKIFFLTLLSILVLTGCGTNENTSDLRVKVEQELTAPIFQMSGLEFFEVSDDLTTLTLFVDDNFFNDANLNQKAEFLKLSAKALTTTIEVEDLNYSIDNTYVYIKRNSNQKTIAAYENGLLDIK